MMAVMGFIEWMWGGVIVRDDQGYVGVLKPGKGTLWFPSLRFQFIYIFLIYDLNFSDWVFK